MQQQNNIKQAVIDFIKAGDERDATQLEKVLHKDFINIQQGYFEQPGIFSINKEHYLRLIREKKFGGAPRTIEFQQVDDLGNLAMVKAKLESEKLIFTSYIHLALDTDGGWKVTGNFPKIDMK